MSEKINSSIDWDKIQVLALDLEGTLISDAFSRIPRPGLWSFLEFCRERFPRIVIFTALSETHFREVAVKLVKAEKVPGWFQELEYIHWDGNFKDLNFIPNTSIETSILIDDYPPFICPEQKENWIDIKHFSKYSPSDQELERIRAILENP